MNESRSFQQLHDILPATVTHIDIPMYFRALNLDFLQVLTDFCDAGQDFGRYLDLPYLFLPSSIFLIRNLPPTCFLFFFVIIVQQHLIERFLLFHASADNANQETVPQGFQSFALRRQFITGSHQQLQRKFQFRISIPKQLFIDDRQQRILNSRTGFPYFIQKHDIRCRQIPVHSTLVFIRFLQTADAHRTKDLIRCGETRHQVFKCPCIYKSSLQPTGHHRLCHPRRSQQQNTFARQSSQQRQTDFSLFLIYPPVHFGQQQLYTFFYFHIIL